MIDYSIARKEELAKYTDNLLHKLTISDVPDVFYSEVMSDMDYLINAL
jgi:hypothetical protein